MITLRRAGDRHHDHRRNRDVWLTFDRNDRTDRFAHGFGGLETLNEDRLAPNASVAARVSRRDLIRDLEIVTYVREGALAHEDSTGRRSLVLAGEFQRMATGQGLRHTETNASRQDWAHVFQFFFRGATDSEYEQKRFCAADRRGGLCVIASPDARQGSLRIQEDAVMYSAMLEPGQHVVHELAEGRRAWVHVVEGEAMVSGDFVLTTGDGAGISAERSVSITARGETELFLVNVGGDR